LRHGDDEEATRGFVVGDADRLVQEVAHELGAGEVVEPESGQSQRR
jgi:hypothetical protein